MTSSFQKSSLDRSLEAELERDPGPGTAAQGGQRTHPGLTPVGAPQSRQDPGVRQRLETRAKQVGRKGTEGRRSLGWAVTTSTANAGGTPGFSVHLCPQAYALVSSFGGLLGLSRLPFFRERETPLGRSGSWCQAPLCCS